MSSQVITDMLEWFQIWESSKPGKVVVFFFFGRGISVTSFLYVAKHYPVEKCPPEDLPQVATHVAERCPKCTTGFSRCHQSLLKIIECYMGWHRTHLYWFGDGVLKLEKVYVTALLSIIISSITISSISQWNQNSLSVWLLNKLTTQLPSY